MKFSVLITVFLLAIPILAQDKITLNTPVPQVTIASYTPSTLVIQVNPPRIRVVIVDIANNELIFEYPCNNKCAAESTPAQVTVMITALNTANLSTRSLWKRVFDRLIVDFPEKFPGGADVK